MMRNRNTNKMVLIISEAAATLAVLIICLMSMENGSVMAFSGLAAHSILIFIFSLVYSSSEAFMKTDRLFVKRFALASILSDIITAGSRKDCVFSISLVSAFNTKLMLFLVFFQLANLLGTVIFYRKYTNKGVRYYKFFSTLICVFLAYIIPYTGSLNHTLNNIMAALPIGAAAVGIAFGCFAQLANPGQDTAPLRNLALLAILAAEFLQFEETTIVTSIVIPMLLLVSLVWVIIIERLNARHFR